jgi:DNA/RNA endonuclease YhcR with UshA esterase domain
MPAWAFRIQTNLANQPSMKIIRLACFLALLLTGSFVFAQNPVSPDSAKFHEGSLTTICGKIYSVHTGKNGIVKFNFGADYPDNTFTAVIFADDAGKFKKPEEYNGKQVCVTGKVQLYKGKAEIILKDVNQVREQ